jgi:uncharacterized protein DUF2786
MTYQEAIDKAIKLLRLSKSSNEHEAALAASRAQEIIDRYKLDISNLDYEKQEDLRDKEPIKDFGYEDPLDDFHGSSSQIWRVKLSTCVALANECKAVYKQVGSNQIMIRIVGQPSNVSAVRYIYAYFIEEIKRICSDKCAGNSSTFKRSFCLGMVDTIWKKLKEQKEATVTSVQQEHASNPMALVRVNNAIAKSEARSQAVAQFVANQGCSEKHNGSSRTFEGMNARQQGQQAGHQVRMPGGRGALNSGRGQLT